jgi:hypothetical protein
MWQKEQEQNADFKFWDRHAISAQRYFNMACLIYGSDPSEFAEFAKTTRLPPDRAEWPREFFLRPRASYFLSILESGGGGGSRTRSGAASYLVDGARPFTGLASLVSGPTGALDA